MEVGLCKIVHLMFHHLNFTAGNNLGTTCKFKKGIQNPDFQDLPAEPKEFLRRPPLKRVPNVNEDEVSQEKSSLLCAFDFFLIGPSTTSIRDSSNSYLPCHIQAGNVNEEFYKILHNGCF